MKRRCEIMVRAGTYRAPGQCQKTLRLRVVKIADTQVTVCTSHAKVLGAGKQLAIAEQGARR